MAGGDELVFYVNGTRVRVPPSPSAPLASSLAHYLRSSLRLCSVKPACEQGVCGACTVMLAKCRQSAGGGDDGADTEPTYAAVNACLVPLWSVHGCSVTTAEGLGTVRAGVHPVQQRLADGHASQCGYCTPGFVVAMAALLRNNAEPSREQIDSALAGNLCRCTGYRPIMEACYSFSKEGHCGAGDECCMKNKAAAQCEDGSGAAAATALVDWTQYRPYDRSQDPIFPPMLLKEHAGLLGRSLKFASDRLTVHLPHSVDELVRLVGDMPHAKVVASGCWAALSDRLNPQPVTEHRHWISTANCTEMRRWRVAPDGVEIGGALTLDEMQRALAEAVQTLPEQETRFMKALHDNLDNLFSQQLRNQASWVGNVCDLWRAPSDIAGALAAAGGHVVAVSGGGGARRIDIADELYTHDIARGKTVLRAGEVVRSLIVPKSNGSDLLCTGKQGVRHGRSERPTVVLDARFSVNLADGTVTAAKVICQGLANQPIRMDCVQEAIVDARLDQELLGSVQSAAEKDARRLFERYGTPSNGEFRASLSAALMLHILAQVGDFLTSKAGIAVAARLPEPEERIGYESLQLYEQVDSGQLAADPMYRPLAHASALKHATGEAQYTSDMAAPGMAHLALVLSARPHARIVGVDTSEALRMPGVLGYVDVSDIPAGGMNTPDDFMQGFVDDTQVFADGKVTCYGQCIGAIAAEDVATARNAVKAVNVTYEDLPAIVSLEDGIAAESWMGPPTVAGKQSDKLDEAFAQCDRVLEGTVRLGAQEHVYLETQTALVVPNDGGDEYTVYCSTQAPRCAQLLTANILNMPANKVQCIVKRVGGAFGGKGFQHRGLCPAVVAAAKLGRPVHCHPSRSDDFANTGKRSALLARYKVGFHSSGRLHALDASVYIDGGNWMDGSLFTCMFASHQVDHVYDIPYARSTGYAVRTHTASNTPFRGAGGPEGFYVAERIVERVAAELGMCVDQVRQMNFAVDGSLRLLGDVVRYDNLRRCWDECRRMAKYDELAEQCEQFNRTHVYRKRGVALLPTRWSMGHGGDFEQAMAMVNVYTDGTVLVNHDGVEMGQGLINKVLSAASRELRIPLASVHCVGTDTTRNANPQPSGGSQGSDVNALAVQRACEQLNERLRPFKEANASGGLADWAKEAVRHCVCLSAIGVGTPDRSGLAGHQNRYFVSGAAVAEVELACTTGDYRLVGAHIVMDVGKSMNPAVDIGQIEGGFMQGVGLFTMEEVRYNEKGVLATGSLFNYKIPNIHSVPPVFNIGLLRNAKCDVNVYSSKGTGEPSLFLGYAAYSALHRALAAAKQTGDAAAVAIDSPATVAKVCAALRL